MSVNINWDTLTGGADGQHLAEVVRAFIHERFQQIALPKLIRSVKVHAFEFGSVAPDIVLKDVCEPLPDFYENDEEEGDGEDEGNDRAVHDHHPTPMSNVNASLHPHALPKPTAERSRRPSEQQFFGGQASTPALTRGAVMGSTSNMSYFHLPGMAAGATTPLAAVAGAHFQNGIPHAEHHDMASSRSHEPGSPSSTASPPSRPVSRDQASFLSDSRRTSAAAPAPPLPDESQSTTHPPQSEQREIERSPEDLQVVFHVTYAGDVRLSMTADVFLDYPMPSFVGIPLKLNITGLTFNGVGILAYIRKRAHLCFLCPEDAEALVGSESAAAGEEMHVDGDDDGGGGGGGGYERHDGERRQSRVGALLEEIKIESEMGESGEGKQVLKNVGKIEKFILEQVQRLFEEEFVYPSFWTFLV